MNGDDVLFFEHHAAAQSLKNMWTRLASTYGGIMVVLSRKNLVIMIMENRKYNFAINAYFYFLGFLLAITSLSACSENIPPASNLVSGEVTLSWNEVPNAISYNVYGSTSPGVTKRNGEKISNVKNPHTIKGLKPGTYFFVVTAVNDLGESAESEEFSISID